jgi:hypothetical protein
MQKKTQPDTSSHKPLVDLRKHPQFARFYSNEELADALDTKKPRKKTQKKQEVKERTTLSEMKARFVTNDYLTRTCLGGGAPTLSVDMVSLELYY